MDEGGVGRVDSEGYGGSGSGFGSPDAGALRSGEGRGAHSGVGEDEREQLAILTHMVRDLKLKLAQATQVWGLGKCGGGVGKCVCGT